MYLLGSMYCIGKINIFSIWKGKSGDQPEMIKDDPLKENRTWLPSPILPAVSLAATLAAYVQEEITPPTAKKVWFNVVEMLTAELGMVEVMM